eukprot:752009-Hanusia_phi.AAC.5
MLAVLSSPVSCHSHHMPAWIRTETHLQHVVGIDPLAADPELSPFYPDHYISLLHPRSSRAHLAHQRTCAELRWISQKSLEHRRR